MRIITLIGIIKSRNPDCNLHSDLYIMMKITSSLLYNNQWLSEIDETNRGLWYIVNCYIFPYYGPTTDLIFKSQNNQSWKNILRYLWENKWMKNNYTVQHNSNRITNVAMTIMVKNTQLSDNIGDFHRSDIDAKYL